MIYLMSYVKTSDNIAVYTMYETHTESIMTGDKAYVNKLVSECKMEPVNMIVTNKEIKFKQWPNQIGEAFIRNHTYILLGRITEQRFKLLRFDERLVYMDKRELMSNIKLGNILNCLFEEGEYKSIDTYNTGAEESYRQCVVQKYEVFRAKSLMLGLDISFEYNIEGTEVKIISYTGKSRRVIVPRFITTIAEKAFRNKKIKELTLSEGLKHVGQSAFAYNNLEHVVIPKTVEFVGRLAFQRNTGLVHLNGEYKDTVKTLSNTTILL